MQIMQDWNSLPGSIVEAGSLNHLKCTKALPKNPLVVYLVHLLLLLMINDPIIGSVM